MCVNVLSVCMSVYHHMHAWCSQIKRQCWNPWNWNSDGCELPCGSWEQNLGLLQEQTMLLILSHPSSPLRDFVVCGTSMYPHKR